MDRNSYQALFARVSNWNAARYNREFNLQLLLNLLNEEFGETKTATANVEILDGRCDQAYVALGGIWKLDLPEELVAEAFGIAGVTIDQAMAVAKLSDLDLDLDLAIKLNINALQSEAIAATPEQTATILAMICLLNHAAVEQKFGVNFYDAMHIVCDANDSKAVKKVASDVKANIDKGSSFVPPEARLQALLDEVQNVKH